MLACENWIKSRSMDSLMGPFNFSTNHEVGFLIKGFDRPPAIMMPYTKSYYPNQLAGLGYRKEQEIRGNGDARATKIYADAYNRDREFYAFMRSMQAYKNSLQTGTTVLLSEKSDFLKYLHKSR